MLFFSSVKRDVDRKNSSTFAIESDSLSRYERLLNDINLFVVTKLTVTIFDFLPKLLGALDLRG